MKAKRILTLALAAALAFAGCTTAPTAPDTTPEGLVRVKHAEADLVYLRPAAKLDGYRQVLLLEPKVAFRKNWLSDVNVNRTMNRVTDEDMQAIIATGKKLLTEEFTQALTKGGYTVATAPGPDVLAVSAAIVELDVYAPDPDDMGGVWAKTYTNGSGEATLFLELFDSVTGQLLARALDRKTNANDGFSWRIPRSQVSNIQDARNALGSWAEMLVKGLDRAKAAKNSRAKP